jgi:hypothetical protein
MLKFSYIYILNRFNFVYNQVRRVLILEEFLAARPRHHRQRVTFLEVTAAADIILPLLDLCFHVSLTYICHLDYGFHDCTYWMYLMIV